MHKGQLAYFIALVALVAAAVSWAYLSSTVVKTSKGFSKSQGDHAYIEIENAKHALQAAGWVSYQKALQTMPADFWLSNNITKIPSKDKIVELLAQQTLEEENKYMKSLNRMLQVNITPFTCYDVKFNNDGYIIELSGANISYGKYSIEAKVDVYGKYEFSKAYEYLKKAVMLIGNTTTACSYPFLRSKINNDLCLKLTYFNYIFQMAGHWNMKFMEHGLPCVVYVNKAVLTPGGGCWDDKKEIEQCGSIKPGRPSGKCSKYGKYEYLKSLPTGNDYLYPPKCGYTVTTTLKHEMTITCTDPSTYVLSNESALFSPIKMSAKVWNYGWSHGICVMRKFVDEIFYGCLPVMKNGKRIWIPSCYVTYDKCGKDCHTIERCVRDEDIPPTAFCK